MYSNNSREEKATLLSVNRNESKKSRRRFIIILLIVLIAVVLPLVLLGVGGLTAYLIITHKYPYHGDALHWDWSKINVNDISFPREFMWGSASSAHEIEGNCTNNQWYIFERKVDPDTGKTPIADGQTSGMAADFWSLYSEDIDRMSSMGLNSFRFSIEWSKIEPQKGQFDNSVIQHYHKVLDDLLDHNIEPIATMFHFTEPIWFTNLGGWTKHENLDLFYSYCSLIYKEYNRKVKYWVTINSPNAYALQGWDKGLWPPGQKDNKKVAADVMAHMAEAHVGVYQMIKAQPEGNSSRVGMVLNVQQFDPANATNPLDRMISNMVEGVYTGGYLSYFQSGKFSMIVPGEVTKIYTNPLAPHSLDFFGMNYYGNAYVKFTVSKEKYEIVQSGHDIISDIGWPIYPEGIYRALRQISEKLPNLPILIAENGVADARDKYRDLFIKRYLYATSKAMKEGSNVIGYMHWALVDNFQWEYGFTMKFGLYAVDFTTQKRTLRNGAKAYINVIKRFSTFDQVMTWENDQI